MLAELVLAFWASFPSSIRPNIQPGASLLHHYKSSSTNVQLTSTLMMAMINRKDTPAPTMQRAYPPPFLNFNTAPTKSSSYKNSPPLTPPYRIRTKSGRAFKVQNDRPSPRETYPDGLTEGNLNNARGAGGNEPPRRERISHDLSLTENPRHSVVDNMLMSLNPDQPRYVSPPSTAAQRPPNSAGSQFSSFKSVRHRGHLHSSSSTSDTVQTVDDSPNRFSTHFNRGRRSNSSSNFQTLGRINSGRHGEGADPKRPNVLSRPRAGTLDQTSVPGSRAGRKSSKSSGSSSVDFGSMMGASTWQSPLHKRSSSFDHGHRRQMSSVGSNPAVTIPTARPPPTASLVPETAIPPIVPSGPRSRDQSPSKQPRVPTVERRDSNASAKAHKVRKYTGGGMDGIGSRAGRSRSPEKQQGPQQLPPPRSIPKPRSTSRSASRGQSPARPYHESSSASRQGSVAPAPEITRERPGFFRRVFGSSARNANTVQNDLRHPAMHSARNSVRADSRTGFSTPQALHRAEASNETAHPTLVKKPSSFFRRRKKSISEPMTAPMAQDQAPSQLHTLDRLNQSIPEPSPVSSLRQVMDPFLQHPATPRRDSSRDGTSATVNTPPSRQPLKSSWSRQRSLQDLHKSRQGHPSGPTAVPRESPDASGIVKIDESLLQPPTTTSYLHDNGSNEEKPAKSRDDLTPKDAEPDVMALRRTVKTFPVDAAYHKENDPRLKSPKTFPLERPPRPSNAAPALSPRNLNATVNQQHDAAPKKPSPQDWLTAAHISPADEKPLPPDPASIEERMWLQADSPEKQRPKRLDTSDPSDGAEVSPISAYETALSSPNLPRPEFTPVAATGFKQALATDPGVLVDECKPTPVDRETAIKVFNGDESVVVKSKAAAWLGDEGQERARIRRAYMDMFEWNDRNILAALRDLCSRLLLKGETQQVDRLLDAFSTRWCTCNPNHGFKAIGKWLSMRQLLYLMAKQTLCILFPTPSCCSTQIYTWPTLNIR